MARTLRTLAIATVFAVSFSAILLAADKDAPQPYFGTGDSGDQTLDALAQMNSPVPSGKWLIVEHVSLHVTQPISAPGVRCRIFGNGTNGSLIFHDLVPEVVWTSATFERRSASTPLKMYIAPGRVDLQCETLITGFTLRVEGSVSGQLIPAP